ncbi:Scarecrow-like protein 30 [Linum grandiflorum]
MPWNHNSMDEFSDDLTHGFLVSTPSSSSGADSEPLGDNIQSPTSGSDKESSSSFTTETTDCFSSVLNYINDVLMEEEQLGGDDDQPCMVQYNSVALQAAERSFYHVLVHPIHEPVNHNLVSSLPIQLQPSLAHFNKHLPGVNGKSKGRKIQDYELSDEYYIRHSKQASVVHSDESAQLESIDSSFLHKASNDEYMPCPLFDESRNKASKKLRVKTRLRRRRANNVTEPPVDLLTLLAQCAQTVGSCDRRRTAIEQLNQIRRFSSPFGDANQRIAHYFANGLESRLAGVPARSEYSASAADVLRAYQLYVSICPFRKMTNRFANRTIAKLCRKAKAIHVIDFGIGYGFQWPCFLHYLSNRPGGPPKVRLTGIDLPQSGFRPEERVQETGRRLKRLAGELNIQFEYRSIAMRWEDIRYEHLGINNNDGEEEFVAVNCIYRMKNLPDDTVSSSPETNARDAMIDLIRSVNPKVFIHGVVNGSYNGSFFATRFKEAMYHFAAFFDMMEANCGNGKEEEESRVVFEREIVGKELENAVACEGGERYERPETYKRWGGRNARGGFRTVKLQREVVEKVKEVKGDYHEDFVMDEDGDWLLLGWKGRIIHAVSAWKPC